MTSLTAFRALAAVGVSLLALPALSATAFAADPSGTYLRDTGASRVRIAKCGTAFCGHLVWLKDATGPAKVGQRIFFDMKPNGENEWRGQAFNPENGKNYSGKMSLSGKTLTTAGCLIGGMGCRSITWSK
ncbi:MAG: DUF2147 domain-containing protein, partial [Actinobacteria bacterium]|nr:DUF2147 domain-containing protein [Actinomycetota bacterium]